MEGKKENPIALRSKKWITDALFKLMKEKKFDEITITDISKESDLVRQTFYKNFDSKEQVLTDYMEKLSKELDEKCAHTNKNDIRNLARLHLEFWYEKSDLVKLLVKHNLLDLINICYKKIIFNVNGNSSKINSSAMKYSSAFIIGGLIKCIEIWAEDDFSISIDDLTDSVLSTLNTDFFY
ncbi:TetR/AcrR family transcriptional regulator [Terrisporobacter sp.]